MHLMLHVRGLSPDDDGPRSEPPSIDWETDGFGSWATPLPWLRVTVARVNVHDPAGRWILTLKVARAGAFGVAGMIVVIRQEHGPSEHHEAEAAAAALLTEYLADLAEQLATFAKPTTPRVAGVPTKES